MSGEHRRVAGTAQRPSRWRTHGYVAVDTVRGVLLPAQPPRQHSCMHAVLVQAILAQALCVPCGACWIRISAAGTLRTHTAVLRGRARGGSRRGSRAWDEGG